MMGWRAALCAALSLASAYASTVVLLDSSKDAYLKEGPRFALDRGSAAALMAAVTGLMPGQEIGAQLSRELSTIAEGSLAKPRAFVALNVAGLAQEALGALFPSRQQRAVELTGKGCPAMAVVDALARVAAANPGVGLTVVDHEGVQNCKEGCVEQNLGSAADDSGADVSALDLSQPEDKLFAVELASIYAGLKGHVAEAQKRAALGVQQDVAVLEVSFMGLQPLARKYGRDSEQLAAAASAVRHLLAWAVKSLDAAYQGDVVYQVLLLEEGLAGVGTVSKLATWKDLTRRQMLTQFPGSNEVQQSKIFATKAAGYGSFILLLYFSLAALYCMCYMPFKQDTLLYGSKKDQ